MGRQIKSVSIPERLYDRLEDIPNFSQWVIAALESPDGRVGSAIDRAASNRRAHIRDLEDIIEDMLCIAEDLKKVEKAPMHHRAAAAKALRENVVSISNLWKETLTIRRKQA